MNDNLRDYQGYTWDFEGVAAELWRVTKPGGVVVWVVADATINGSETGTSFRQALGFMAAGFRLYDTMIWNKPSPQAPTEGRYYNTFEYMFIFSKGAPRTLNLISDRVNKSFGVTSSKETRSSREDRKPTGQKRVVKKHSRRFNVWNVSRADSQTTHPAIFPEALARDHIISWSNPGDIVFDPFLGSGTTAKMALKLDRQCIGIELSQEYCDIAIERLNKARADLGQSHTVNVNGVEAKQGAMFE